MLSGLATKLHTVLDYSRGYIMISL